MMFKLVALVPLLSFLVSSAVAASSAPVCLSGCMEKAAASVGCAMTDHLCVQQAVETFKATVLQCVEDQACKNMPEGSQADVGAAAVAMDLHKALIPPTEFDGMLAENAGAVMSRFIPRESSLTERQNCNTGDNLCVSLSSSRCNTYCQRCHRSGSSCVDCSEGICAGTFGLTCVCQTPCVSC